MAQRKYRLNKLTPVNMSDETGNLPKWATIVICAVVYVSTVAFAPAVAGAAVFVAVATVAMPSKQEHYARNDNQKDLPKTTGAVPKDWKTSDKNDATREKGPSAALHQKTATDKSKPNIKMVSPDGKKEAVYDFKGALVTAPIDIGTYNFIPSDHGTFGWLGHGVKDVLPWIVWGNSEDDPSIAWDRATSLIGG